jgi:uridylate kinase
MQKRIILKVSGEQLGSDEYNFDIKYATRIASILKALRNQGYQVACVMGGGNIVRGKKLHDNGFTNQVIADQMGMLATIQNGLFLAETLKQDGVTDVYLFSNVPVESLVERFSYKRADSKLTAGNVVLIAGGVGKPGFTTDTSVVLQAYELHCPMVVKTTKVDGIYSDDPVKNPHATKYNKLTFKEVLANPNINVMDRAAMALASDKNISIGVCQPDPDKY